MKLPKQSVPVNRQDKFEPHTTVNVIDGDIDELKDIRFELRYGANYNDPMRFLTPVDFCGCHLFSGTSMTICLASCGLL